MAERLINAGLNTLIGISIVFLVLILISFVISLFKYIPKIQSFFEKLKAKRQAKKAAKKAGKSGKSENVELMDKTIEQIIQKEELCNDLELVAVITAAIQAATNQSASSFVVRSVRKVGRKG